MKTSELIKDGIMEAVNNRFYKAVDQYGLDLSAHVTASEFTSSISGTRNDRAFAALRVAIASLIEMMEEHEIEDLNWKWPFTPEFDWTSIRFNNYSTRFNDDNEWEWDSIEYVKDLYLLRDLKVISNLEVIGESKDFVIARFTINGFDSDAMREFETFYKSLRECAQYFGLDVS